MSFGKLYKLEALGFTENTVSGLVSLFEKFTENSIIDFSDIRQYTRQKNKVFELIDFLIQKKFIEDIHPDDDSYENKTFRVLLSKTKTAREKKYEKYFIENDLYNQTKELIIKRLIHMKKNEKDGWILFIDFANFSTSYENENSQLKDKIVTRTLNIVLKDLIERYALAYTGFELSNTNQGDQAEFYFFDESNLDKFIEDFLKAYKKDIYEDVQRFNETRSINNALQDSLYLKIFKAHSKTVQYSEKNNEMPSFNTMKAITLISKIEKPIKKEFIKNKNLQSIDKYFYVSDKQEDSLSDITVNTDNIGPQTVYYKIC